jgi:protein transport protein SEC61 subunit beta
MFKFRFTFAAEVQDVSYSIRQSGPLCQDTRTSRVSWRVPSCQISKSSIVSSVCHSNNIQISECPAFDFCQILLADLLLLLRSLYTQFWVQLPAVQLGRITQKNGNTPDYSSSNATLPDNYLEDVFICIMRGYSNDLSNYCFFQASPRPASPLTSGPESGPDTPSSKPSSSAQTTGSSIARPLSPPGGPRAAIRRRAAADHKESVKNARPSSTRAAGAGGSSGTMLRLYTDESQGFRVDPVVVLVLSLGFIMSVVALHSESRKPIELKVITNKRPSVIAKITKRFS